MCLKEIEIVNGTASIEVMAKGSRVLKKCICDTSESLQFCGGGEYLNTYLYVSLHFSILLDKMLIFSHKRHEVNVTAPDHRLKNPENPKAPLFSRLHMMQNYRLINDRLCLSKAQLDGNTGVWWYSSQFPVYDPFITEIPGEGSHENITHAKLYSCTKVE